MRQTLTFFLISFLTLSLRAQSPACDSVHILSLSYAPFSSQTLEIKALNSGMELFSYPGFLLLNASGDTLAKENVSYFGFLGEQYFLMDILQGVEIPHSVFGGKLELWTSFFSQKACEFDLDVQVCPDSVCRVVFPYFNNYGNGLSIGTFDLSITDSLGLSAYQTSFTLDSVHQGFSTSCCLAPGGYVLAVSHAGGPIEGQPVFGVYTGNPVLGGNPESSYNQIGTGSSLSFTLFEACLEPPLGQNLPEAGRPEISFGNGVLRIANPSASPIRFEVMDMTARTIATSGYFSGTREVSLQGCKSGVYLVKLGGTSSPPFVSKIFVP